MTRSPPATSALPPARNPDKFSFDKATFGGVTYLTMRGTLDHTFEGKKIAASVHTKKLVVNMREVRRFASWGMSEWMDFLRVHAAHDLYLVECSTYAVSQINLVTGLLGHGKLVSFYASYRCGNCNEEQESLFLLPRDRGTFRDLPGSGGVCMACGGHTRLDEYAGAFFEKLAGEPSFDIDDEVLAFLRSHLNYPLTPDLTRIRAARRVHKDYTYLRLTGNITALPGELVAAACGGTTVVDLAGITFDPLQLAGWRSYVDAVLPRVRSLQLLDCPLGFAEYAVVPDDLRDKLKIRTFAVPYDCLRCQTTMAYMVDVAENLEQLVGGVAPAALCPTCSSPLVASPSPDQVAFMRWLPARDRDVALDKLLAQVRTEPTEKLESCLVPLAPRTAASGAPPKRALYVALGLSLVLIGGLAAVAVSLWKKGNDPAPPQAPAVAAPAKPQTPSVERPDWIVSDIPSSAYCHDMINRLMCVGVSAYRRTRDEAVAEANDAALEELVSAVGLKISEPFFRDNVVAGYSAVRVKALSALQGTEAEGGSAGGSPAATDAVAKARKRVVEILRLSGGAAVPTQRSDWYWEEYEAKQGGLETLVFVRYDITVDAVKALVEKYSTQVPIIGSTAVTAFPALAWQYEDFTGGAMLTKVGRPLADAGVTAQSLVMAVGDVPVGDAPSLARRIEEWRQATGDLKLTVKSGGAPARAIEIGRGRVR